MYEFSKYSLDVVTSALLVFRVVGQTQLKLKYLQKRFSWEIPAEVEKWLNIDFMQLKKNNFDIRTPRLCCVFASRLVGF